MEEYKSEEWLSERVNNGHSLTDIAGEVGVATSTIEYWVRKHNVSGIEFFTEDILINNPDWLSKKYHEEGLSLYDISNLDSCPVSEQSLYYRMEYFGIPLSNSSADYKTRAISHGVPEDSKHLDDEWLYEKYVVEERSIRDIASIDGVKASTSSVERALEAFGIERRLEGFQDGEAHPNFNPDSDQYYGKYWNNISKRIRKRDNYTCKSCGITQNEYLQQFDRKLDVHHIVPLREFDKLREANKDDNLITLCVSCHRKVEYGKIECPTKSKDF